MSKPLKKDTWTPELIKYGIPVIQLSEYHFRIVHTIKTIDFWPSTSRWRNVVTGKQGRTILSMLNELDK